MEALTFPYTIFTTQRKMNDTAAADMKYGDLTASQLQDFYHLTDVSERVNPYTCIKLSPFNLPQSRFYNMRGADTEICSYRECARLMFDEMRRLALPFSFYSPYRHLINKMIHHMEYGKGAPFSDEALDRALREQILKDSSEKSTLEAIKATIDRYINYKKGFYPCSASSWLTTTFEDTILPKFNRTQDSFNGLGITVHDIYAMKIKILSLDMGRETWRARVHYQAQDHFGLDKTDIMKHKFRQFKFFRIWFVLQRYQRFGYKPYFTNMSAIINISGGKS
ncbi:DUF3289 family protein [Pantoea sp. FN0302]|uniref:DUF3289 family protein n=1 Tax=Pantoea sp. FN0302 TaxID=3418558 RepID=UPI003CEA5CEE